MSTFDRQKHRERFDALVAAIQALETEAHDIGLHITAGALNRSKNAAGWEATGSPGSISMAALARDGRAMDREKIGRARR